MSAAGLVVESVSFAYAATVLADVSLAARPGEVVAILGANGAGKSTLLKLCARLLAPASGRISWAGRDLAAQSPSAVARQLAYCAQGADPPSALTVGQSVRLGRLPFRPWYRPLGADDRAAVEAALEALGLLEFRDRPVSELSGGEAQRVRLARALAQQPQCLMLDEPTAYLDPRYQQQLLSAVRHLAGRNGVAVLLTLHDLNLASVWSDRLVLLAGGRVVAEGTPGDVLTAANLRAAYDVELAVAPHPATGAACVVVPRGAGGSAPASPETSPPGPLSVPERG